MANNHTTYQDYYNDSHFDPYVDNYQATFHEYDAAVNSPADLRNKVYAGGNAGAAHSHVMLVREGGTTTNPGGSPGSIVLYHRLVRYEPRLGQNTPFNNMAYAFMGDVVGAQAPATVVVPNDAFNQATGARVPVPQRVDELLASEPNAELLGPFDANDPDTEVVTTRMSMFIPHQFTNILLDRSLTPRRAWIELRGAILNANMTAECQALIDWLRVALVRRGADLQPAVTRAPLTSPTLTDPEMTRKFQTYRTGILYHDLPHLNPNQMLAGANQISSNIVALTEETRKAREEQAASRAADKNKTPQDFYGEVLARLMRLAQVSDEAQLTTVHTTIANSKKDKHVEEI